MKAKLNYLNYPSRLYVIIIRMHIKLSPNSTDSDSHETSVFDSCATCGLFTSQFYLFLSYICRKRSYEYTNNRFDIRWTACRSNTSDIYQYAHFDRPFLAWPPHPSAMTVTVYRDPCERLSTYRDWNIVIGEDEGTVSAGQFINRCHFVW